MTTFSAASICSVHLTFCFPSSDFFFLKNRQQKWRYAGVLDESPNSTRRYGIFHIRAAASSNKSNFLFYPGVILKFYFYFWYSQLNQLTYHNRFSFAVIYPCVIYSNWIKCRKQFTYLNNNKNSCSSYFTKFLTE